MAVLDPFIAIANIVGNTVTAAATAWVKASTMVMQSFKTMTEGMNLVKGVADSAFGGLQRLTGAINSTVAAYTQLFNPAATRLLEMAIRDLNASIGEALMPVLRIATAGIRAIADVIASMSPQARSLVAALALATVAAVAMTAAVGVMSAVMNTATAGIPAILGAIAGGLGSLVVVAKPLKDLEKIFQKVGNTFEKIFDTVGASFRKIAEILTPLLDFVVNLASAGAEKIPDLIGPLIDSFGQLIESVLPSIKAVLPALLAIGAVIEQINILAIRVVFAALTPLLERLGEILKPIGYLVEGLALVTSVAMELTSTLFTGLTKAFRLVHDPMKDISKLVEANLGPSLAKLKTSLLGLWDSIRQVFGLIFDAVAKIAKILAEPFIKLAMFVGEVLVVHLQALAYVIETVAAWITTLEDNVRRLFGVERQEETSRVKPGSSVGKATVQASISSIDAYLDKARTSAYGMSRGEAKNDDPSMQTAKNTKKLVDEFETFNKNFGSFMEAIGGIGSNVPSARKVVDTLAPAANAAFMPAMAVRELMRRLG